jgi:hypothetical protein
MQEGERMEEGLTQRREDAMEERRGYGGTLNVERGTLKAE